MPRRWIIAVDQTRRQDGASLPQHNIFQTLGVGGFKSGVWCLLQRQTIRTSPGSSSSTLSVHQATARCRPASVTGSGLVDRVPIVKAYRLIDERNRAPPPPRGGCDGDLRFHPRRRGWSPPLDGGPVSKSRQFLGVKWFNKCNAENPVVCKQKGTHGTKR